jgi:hypothetical protein
VQSAPPWLSGAPGIRYRFECAGVDALVALMTPSDRKCFSVEVESVDWEKYMYDFCWGLQKFVLKEEVPPWEMKNTLKVPHHFGADLQFALEGGYRGKPTPTFDAMPTAASILAAPPVAYEIARQAAAEGVPAAALAKKSEKLFNSMASKLKVRPTHHHGCRLGIRDTCPRTLCKELALDKSDQKCCTFTPFRCR